MDNPWANAWATSDNTSDGPGWEQSTATGKPWTQPSSNTEPAWNPPSPKWTADEPVWRPPTPQWSKSELETEAEPEKEQKHEEEQEPEWSDPPPASAADEEDLQDIIVPTTELPLLSPVPAIDTDAFGSFEAAQWGHVHDASPKADEEEPSRPVDEWELARQEKAKQDQYVPPELLSAILAQLELLSNDIFPQNVPNHDTAPTTLARDIIEAVEGLEAVASQLISTSISLEPIPPFSKSWIHKKTADAVRLSRHSNAARQASPLARYLESKGSTAWEAAVKSRPEPIHDDSDVLPAGWKVLDSQNEKGTLAAPEMKRKSTGILSSFFGRNNKTASPASSTPTSARTSPVPSPRPSIDSGKGPASVPSAATTSTVKHILPSVKPVAPPAVPTPSTSSITSAVISTAEPHTSPDIFPPEAPPPSAVSRFLGRFSRTKSTNANEPSMVLSSDDLDFLTEQDAFKVVPSALDDDDDDPLGFGSLQSDSRKQKPPSHAPLVIPPPLIPSPNAQNGSRKTSLTVPPVLPLGLPTPTASLFDLVTSEDARTPTSSNFNNGQSNATSKLSNGGKGFGWVPPKGSSSSGSPLSGPSSLCSPTVNATTGITSTARHAPSLPPQSKAGKRPTPIAVMSASASSRPTPSPKLPPPPGVGTLPPPSGHIPLLVAPGSSTQVNSPSSLLDLNFDDGSTPLEPGYKAPGKTRGPEKDTLPPLPTESYAGPSLSVDDDDDFADFQDSSFTSFKSVAKSNRGFSPAHSHSVNQSISSTSSASETSFFGGLGDSSMDSSLSMSGSSLSGDGDGDMFSDFDDFVSGLTVPPTSGKSQPMSHSVSDATGSKPALPFTSGAPLSPPSIGRPAVQQSAPQPKSYHQRTQSLVDSAQEMTTWPSSSSIASSPLPTLSRQNTGTPNTFPTPIMSSGTSPALSRQNTGNGPRQPSFPPVIMSTSRQNTTGAFPTVIMSSAHSRQKTGARTSSGVPPILPGPPGFGSLTTASSPPTVMDIFGSKEGDGLTLSLSPGLSSSPITSKSTPVENEDPLDLFGASMGAGVRKPVSTPALVPPSTNTGQGGLSAQDLSFFEEL
ncbi:hypothetical protein L218DRAFT_706679 [Marasmius fiardii PR-910]|nr:hypothetical protein L218DRAFT_706679 [Marasmius fiardii PR-910]